MNNYRKELKSVSQEAGFTGWHLFKMGVVLILVLFTLGAVTYSLGWFSEAAQVVKEEFGPRASLDKYEWFKDASAQLDKKLADIGVYEQRIKQMESDYEGTARKDWDRTDKESMNQWQTELVGVKSSYNSLSAEYNSQMAKFNWQFANVGSLPKGADEPLPRGYKPYSEF